MLTHFTVQPEFPDRLSGNGQKVYTRFPLYLHQATKGSVNHTAQKDNIKQYVRKDLDIFGTAVWLLVLLVTFLDMLPGSWALIGMWID